MRSVVTGGTSGIGADIVRRLRSQGAAVVFTGRDLGPRPRCRDEDRQPRSSAPTFAIPKTSARRCTPRSRSSVGSMRSFSTPAFSTTRLSRMTTDQAWDAVMETNLIGPTSTRWPVCPLLRPSENASITAISSDAAVWGETSIGAYSVSKRGPEHARPDARHRGRAGRSSRQRCLPGGYRTGHGYSRRRRVPRPEISPDGRCRRSLAWARVETSLPRSPSSPRTMERSATARCCWSTAACGPRSGRARSPCKPGDT